MSITLDGSSLTIEKLVRIARERETVELDPRALERIRVCRVMIEEKIAAHETMYGTNTGIGEFSEVVLTDEQVGLFQRALVYNHAAGIGEPAPQEVVRGAMAGRINVHAHGNSGIRPEITQTLVAMLNAGVTPVVCQKGSVGACGDLAPMAQLALSLMGEGESFYQGERIATRVALERAGIAIPGLQARDGLGTINGANVLTAMSALLLYDAEPGCARPRSPAPCRSKPCWPTSSRTTPACTSCAVSPVPCQPRPPSGPASRAPTWRPARSRPRCRTPTPCAPRRR